MQPGASFMNEHALRVLEYDKVTGIVAGYAASTPGREAVLALRPASDAALVATLLQETREFTLVLQGNEAPPFDGIQDIRLAIRKLGVSGGMLSPQELLATAQTLGSGRRVKRFFQRDDGRGASSRLSLPLLLAKADAIRTLKPIEDAILAAIDDRAEVKDSASPALRKIRKQLVRTREDILERMTDILQDSSFQKVIQEPVITVRDDRYVLPLKPNFRQSLPGVVHGQSGSRSTLFVEPLEVLEQNNRLAELRMDEQEEVERILRALTALMAPEADAITETLEALAGLDAVCARARFGIEFNGVVPLLSSDGSLRMRAARHPLLVDKYRNAGDGKSIAPNDIELEAHQRTLILSGPNAGGKTVVLKTVGLLSLMAQSGLPVTSAEGSEFPFFCSVFADIGDEQSLEQDLSTFSSHMGQIAEIIRSAQRGSLVLLDELGSGTDPGEGTALGAAVLEKLMERGAVTVVTTHHNALKLFGSQTDGAVNAAMEFDLQMLKPTYRLTPGRPGRSYGLDMAARLGIPDEVIRKARGRLSEDDTKLEDLLKQVEEDSRLLASDRDALAKELSVAGEERIAAAALLKAAHEEVRAAKTKAKQDARDVLSELRQKLREFSRVQAFERAELKTEISVVEALAAKLEPGVFEQEAAPGAVYAFEAGDRVRIPNVNKTGTVLGSRQGVLELDVDGKKIKLSANRVSLIGALPQDRKLAGGPSWGAELHELQGAPDRLNIIGLHVEEGLAEVDRFIDRASMTGLSIVTIIHGLGTGALKKAVTEFIKNHPLIAAMRPGEPPEGGAGVTVAELKK